VTEKYEARQKGTVVRAPRGGSGEKGREGKNAMNGEFRFTPVGWKAD